MFFLLDTHTVTNAKSRCIFNGRAPMTPTEKFDAVKEEISALKDNADTKVILHVARCSPPKNRNCLSAVSIPYVNKDAMLYFL